MEETVKQFNAELLSLYESKPPVSRAKIVSITRLAMMGIKYYKHIVHNVEKFICKCRKEYKIPGLFVIDSILRQSRSQFGSEKDVYTARFARNIKNTFFHIFKCSQDEKSQVIRVLNLWQKKNVFSSDIVQPLFDLADPQSALSIKLRLESDIRGEDASSKKMDDTSQFVESTLKFASVASQNRTAEEQKTDNFVESYLKRDDIFLSRDVLKVTSESSQSANFDVNGPLTMMLRVLSDHAVSASNKSGSELRFNKRLLSDFDYSDEEDATSPASLTNGQHPKPVLTDSLCASLKEFLSNSHLMSRLQDGDLLSQAQVRTLEQLVMSHGLKHTPDSIGIVPHNNVSQPLHSRHTEFVGKSGPTEINPVHPVPPVVWPQSNSAGGSEDEIQVIPRSPTRHSDYRTVSDSPPGRHQRKRRHRRTPDRESGKSRREQRDRSPSHRRRRRRSSSPRQSHNRHCDAQWQRERERRGLPPIQNGKLSVCSTTLWVGHLSRLVSDEDLSDVFGEIGVVDSINLVKPRGCAYVKMNRRMDAAKALDRLYKYEIANKAITLFWAPGKGMKDAIWKDYWDVDHGVSYIPYDKLCSLPTSTILPLEEGGMFDDETVPEWLRKRLEEERVHLPTPIQMDNNTALDVPVVPDDAQVAVNGSAPPLPLAPPPPTMPGLADFMAHLRPGFVPPVWQDLPPNGGAFHPAMNGNRQPMVGQTMANFAPNHGAAIFRPAGPLFSCPRPMPVAPIGPPFGRPSFVRAVPGRPPRFRPSNVH